jgi:hypothetical protein
MQDLQMMKHSTLILLLAVLASACGKYEKAARISGVWELEETVITNYVDNEPQGDSLVDQSGLMYLEPTDGYENVARTNFPNSPCLSFCYWELPKKKADQIFFSYQDELLIYTSTCTIEKSTKNRLVLMQANYDADLNVHSITRWKFRKGKL